MVDYSISGKEDIFCNFLFASLHAKRFLKRGLLNKFFPFRPNPISERSKNNLSKLPHLKAN